MAKVNELATVVGGQELTEEMLANIAANSRGELGFFAGIGHEAGVLDSPLKNGKQLETEEVVMRLIHISAANITRAVDDNGVVSDFAVVTFDEFPEAYYQGGGRLTDLVIAWATAVGDEFSTKVEQDGNKRIINFSGDRLLPHLNASFDEHAHPAIVLKWKKGKKQEYVDVMVLGG